MCRRGVVAACTAPYTPGVGESGGGGGGGGIVIKYFTWGLP